MAEAAQPYLAMVVADAQGKVVRHLAAGMLGGKNPPPEPLKAGLVQAIEWNLRDDAGKPAAGGPFKVPVRLGMKPWLEKILGQVPGGFFGSIEALTVSPTGELYVLDVEQGKVGRAELKVLDKDGKYLRTIAPYPANTPKERTESVGHILADGERIPMLFSGHANTVYPMVCGIRGQTMAWHPKGYLVAVSSPGTAREHGPLRHRLAFHPQGGTPEGIPFVGPQLLAPRGFLGGGGERYARGLDRVAVSPDGGYVYAVQEFSSGYFDRGLRKHGVWRLKWSDKEAGEPPANIRSLTLAVYRWPTGTDLGTLFGRTRQRGSAIDGQSPSD